MTKDDLGFNPHPPVKTSRMFQLIESKGGIAYLLSSKMTGKSIEDVTSEIGEGMSRRYITVYLKQYGLTYTSLYEYNNVYYVPHLKKWRGTIIINDIVIDTDLFDDINDALYQVEKYKKEIREK